MRIELFASIREQLGQSAITLAEPAPATVGELRARLMNEFPSLAMLLPRCAVAVDFVYATDETVLPTTAEIAILPPVSGGSGSPSVS